MAGALLRTDADALMLFWFHWWITLTWQRCVVSPRNRSGSARFNYLFSCLQATTTAQKISCLLLCNSNICTVSWRALLPSLASPSLSLSRSTIVRAAIVVFGISLLLPCTPANGSWTIAIVAPLLGPRFATIVCMSICSTGRSKLWSPFTYSHSYMLYAWLGVGSDLLWVVSFKCLIKVSTCCCCARCCHALWPPSLYIHSFVVLPLFAPVRPHTRPHRHTHTQLYIAYMGSSVKGFHFISCMFPHFFFYLLLLSASFVRFSYLSLARTVRPCT